MLRVVHRISGVRLHVDAAGGVLKAFARVAAAGWVTMCTTDYGLQCATVSFLRTRDVRFMYVYILLYGFAGGMCSQDWR